MKSVTRYFQLAKQVALKGGSRRRYRLGAVGIRSDGAIVAANNITTRKPEPRAHAETRLTRKLDWGSNVYVVRILSDGTLAMAKPCKHCQNAMRLRGIRYCYYSISDSEYGVLILKS